MSSRSQYTSVSRAAQGVGGNNNLGIYVVRHNRTNKTYIEKRVRPSAICQGDIQHEIQVMQQCNGHPNIVSVMDYDLNYRSLRYGSVYMQHAELGSLDALIGRFAQRRSQRADEGFAWKVLWDLSIGLAHLWTGQDARTVRQLASSGRSITNVRDWNPVIHRDLKPSNIFMTWHDPLRIDTCPYPTMLIGDFGCAVTGDDIRNGRGMSNNLPVNDATFAPPEFPSFSEQGDVFSIGLIIVCIAYRSQVPPDGDPLQGNGASEAMAIVLRKCMMRREKDRPSPHTLPTLVWWGYQKWCAGRSDSGRELPGWAFGD